MRITNELGHEKTVPQGASEGSPLFIKIKYPRQLNDQIEKYLQQVINKVENPVIEFFTMSSHEENSDFVRAVQLYAEHPEWL